MKKEKAIVYINGWFKHIFISTDDLKRGYIKIIYPPPLTEVMDKIEKLEPFEVSIPYKEIIVYYTGEKLDGCYLFEY